MQPQQAPLPQPHDYEFIVNPAAPPRRSPLALAGGSLPKRLFVGLGALFVLIILIVVIKGLLGGGTSFTPYTSVVQEQQELIHLSTNAAQQAGLTITDQNFAVTAELSLTSAQTQLLTYLSSNHQKLSAKVLNLKVSSSLDNQLLSAATNSTYDQVFQQTMQSQLTTYQQSLTHAYTGAGAKGKALLKSDYTSAAFLLKQLASPAS